MSLMQEHTTDNAISAVIARHAASLGEAPAVIFGDEVRSWRALRAASNRMARSLAARGVRQGDLLTIALPNSLAMIETCLAAWTLGATPQPVPHRAPTAELIRVAALARPPLIVADRSELTIDGIPVAAPATLLAESLDEAELPVRIAPAYKAPLSGGSTGRPKLIVSTAPGVVDLVQLAFWRLRRGEIVVMPGPLSHNAPFMTTFQALLAGGTVVLLPRFDAEAVLAAVDRHRASWLYLVPTMMQRILRLPEAVRARFDVSSLKTVWHMAAPCAPTLKQAWIHWIGPEAIWELYAGTEAQAATAISGTEWLQHPGSVGKVIAGEIKVVAADTGDTAAARTPGVIYMRSSDGRASYRYVGAEAERLGEWETLGDVGWFDDEGYLYLGDRRDDMVLVGGSNVYPAEVEQAIESCPDVTAAVVIGLPDDDLGQRLHAIIQSSSAIDSKALGDRLTELLEPHKRPRSFEFVTQDLRDEAGKVRRSALRAARLAMSGTAIRG